MSEIELLPCPSCGGAASVYKRVETAMTMDLEDDWPDFYAGCHNGCLQTPPTKNRAVAVKHWNTRVNPDELSRLKAEVERLEQFVRSLDGFESKVFDAKYVKCSSFLIKGVEGYVIMDRDGDSLAEGSDPFDALQHLWKIQDARKAQEALTAVEGGENEDERSK